MIFKEKYIKGNILDFKPVNERICVLRPITTFFNLSIINAHAETEEKDETVKESFYQTLQHAYDRTHSNDMKLVIGDLNVKIGWKPIFEQTTGRQSPRRM